MSDWTSSDTDSQQIEDGRRIVGYYWPMENPITIGPSHSGTMSTDKWKGHMVDRWKWGLITP